MKNSPLRSKATRNQRGFSLAEVIIASSIMALVIGGTLAFNLQMIKAGYFSEMKNQINRDIRKVTNELSDMAMDANYFTLYRSFDSEDRNSASDRLFGSETGDFIVFVFLSDQTNTLGNQLVDKVAGYYRQPGEENMGPVQKFVIEYSTPVDISSSSSTKLEDLFANSSNFSSTDEILQLTKGLARGRLFYNFENRAIMVNGQIYHSKNTIRYSDTYNLTISTRG